MELERIDGTTHIHAIPSELRRKQRTPLPSLRYRWKDNIPGGLLARTERNNRRDGRRNFGILKLETILKLALALFLFTLSLAGCAARHKGYQQASDYYRTMMASSLSDPAWYAGYYKETDPQKKMDFRNRLIGYCIWLADEDFNAAVTRFSRNQVKIGLAFDLTSLGVSAASAVVPPAAVLGAVATGIQGIHAAYDRDAMNQQTTQAILLKMDALRQDKLADIYKSERLPDAEYSLVQGLIDVQLYVNAGTVHAALAAISQEAAIQHQATSTALKELRR